MKILLDVKDEKVSFVLEMLRNFKFIKAEPFSKADDRFFTEFKEAIEEVKLIKAGKLEGKLAEEWLNEL